MANRGGGALSAELIYDALIDDEAFSRLSVDLAAAVGARSAVFGWRHGVGGGEIMTHSGYFTDDNMADYIAQYTEDDLWIMSALPVQRRNRAWDLDQLVPDTIYRESRFYNEWIRGMGDDTFHCLGSSVVTGDGAGIIGLHRGRGAERFDSGEVANLSSMMPALSRVLSIRGRLLAARRYHADEVALLDAVSLSVIVVTSVGELMRANTAGEALLSGHAPLTLKQGRVLATGPGAARLQQAIALATDRAAPAASSVRLSHDLVVTVSPHRTGGGQRRALLLAPPSASSPIEVAVRASFGLTDAEASVAVMLARGHDLRFIARERGTSYATVRTQVRSIAAKMECSRQTQIAAMVSRVIATG